MHHEQAEYIGSDGPVSYTHLSILYTDNPASGNWEAVPAILHNLQDPDLVIDDDGKAYMFWGSSNAGSYTHLPCSTLHT